MGSIEKLAHIDYLLVILGFFAILFAAKEILEIFGYFKKKFRIKTGNEEDKETVENRIKTLENMIIGSTKKFKKYLEALMILKTILYKKRYLIFDGNFLIFVLLLQVGRIIIEKLLNIFFELMSNMKKYFLIII